ncbi:MAG: phosphoesterase [Myxococcota bacterium]|mgnify:CR=1 FL=1
MPRRITVLHHDNCFDGVASSAIFSRFYRGAIDANAEFRFRGVHHRVGNPFESRWFDGDENAVLDFRYTSEPKLTWWFDHHITTFSSPEDEAQFRADTSGQKFWDPSSKSNTKFIARIAREKFGWEASELADLVYWADLIDGAQFPDAKTAVELASPALKLMTVIEANRERDFLPKLIVALAESPVASVADRDDVKQRLSPLLERHQRAIETLRARSKMDDGVVTYDVADTGIENANKFILYYLFPDCRYAVGVSLSATRSKVSVGSNPWSGQPRLHNLGRICERFGGGGHAVVGAITLGPKDLEKARGAARQIATELRADPTPA